MSEIRYSIVYDPKIYDKLLEFPKVVQAVIIKNIEKKLRVDPYAFGKPLVKQWKNHFLLRVGDYRVIYRIQDEIVTVLIVEVDHRKDVYT